MAQDDNIDADFDQDAGEDFSDGAEQQASEKPIKKSGGKFAAVVAVVLLGGGAVVAAPFLGISIPGLTPPPSGTAETAVNTTPVTAPPAPASAISENVPSPLEAASDPVLALPLPVPEPLSAPVQIASEPEADLPQDGMGVGASDIIAPDMAGAISSVPQAEGAMSEMADTSMVVPPDAIIVPEQAAGGAVDSLAPSVPEGAIDPLAISNVDPLGVADTPAQGEVTAPENSVVQQAFVEAQPVPAVEPEVAVPAVAQSADLSKIEERISDIEKSIADIENNLVTKDHIDDLKASIEILEKSIGQNKSSIALKAAKREVENYRQGIMPEVVKAEKYVAETISSKPKSTRKAIAATTGAGSAWVLKSAKPGTAWVATKGSSELKTVSVGDVLSGVGKITSIDRDSSGRWVVSGTKGFVRQ